MPLYLMVPLNLLELSGYLWCFQPMGPFDHQSEQQAKQYHTIPISMFLVLPCSSSGEAIIP